MEFSDIAIFVSGVCLGAFCMALFAVKQISEAFDDGFRLGEQYTEIEMMIKELSEERDGE